MFPIFDDKFEARLFDLFNVVPSSVEMYTSRWEEKEGKKFFYLNVPG